MGLSVERPRNVERTWVERDRNARERLQIPGRALPTHIRLFAQFTFDKIYQFGASLRASS